MTVWVINPQVREDQQTPPEHSSPHAAVAAAFIIQHPGECAAEKNQCVSAKRGTLVVGGIPPTTRVG